MANRRMFSKDITESDAFKEMPLSSQALYFHLGMNADDDGVVNNPKSIQRCIGASLDDLKILLAKRFVIAIEESGLIVIKHWKINNYIQRDRYTPTKYQKELKLLGLDENNAYQFMDTTCIQDGYIDKKRIEEISIDKNRLVQSSEALDKKDIKKLNSAKYLFILLVNNHYVSFDDSNKENYIDFFYDLLCKDTSEKELNNQLNNYFEDEFDEDDITGDRYQYFVNSFTKYLNDNLASTEVVDDDDLPF